MNPQQQTDSKLNSGTALASKKPRLGQISFINCLPIVLPLQQGKVQLDADVVLDTPSRLNAMFAAGALDVGAMSSFYYLQQGDLQLIPNVSIACTGPVGSVLFFSKKPPRELSARSRIVASAQSATSVNLLRVLCHEHFGFDPQIQSELTPDLEADDADAALVIGDRALDVDARWTSKFSRVDMGQWWVETFDRPMVFGVWAAQRRWAQNNPQEYVQILAALESAKTLGFSDCWNDVLQAAQDKTGLSTERLTAYYQQELNFDLTAKHLEGLELYRGLCQRLGLLPE